MIVLVGSTVLMTIGVFPINYLTRRNVNPIVMIKKEEKIVACSKTPLSGSKYTATLRFLNGRFPSTRTKSIVCKKGYKPLTAQIDVIYQDGNTLTAKKENIVYGCM